MDTVLGWLKGIGGWIGGIIAMLLFIGVLYLLGKTGQLVRKGVETKKALNKAKLDAAQKRLVVTSKWHEYNRKATLWITGPILGWIGVYVVLFLVLPLGTFLVSLLGLIPPVLGYFGIFFVPSGDLDDYLPS